MQTFSKTSLIQAPAATVFSFHERPDALHRLQPPWQTTRIVVPPSSLEVGTRVVLQVKLGPLWQTIEALHTEYEPGRMFVDRMERGPFRHWIHRHLVEPVDDHSAKLTDLVEYALPLPPFGQWFGGWFARRELERLFDYRHQVTLAACEDSD